MALAIHTHVDLFLVACRLVSLALSFASAQPKLKQSLFSSSPFLGFSVRTISIPVLDSSSEKTRNNGEQQQQQQQHE
jgi:hypothetical protein